LDLSSSALAIAVLGLLEALAIAKAIAVKSGQWLDYNRQILAEGLGNLVGGFFRCMPGAGSLSRTAINYQAGAVTRFSGVFAAAFVALTVLIFAPLASYVPKALLAGLLIVAAARLFDLERLRYILRGSRYDAVLLVATAFSAIAINIEFAILIGAAVSIAWYVTRASKLKAAELIVTPSPPIRRATVFLSTTSKASFSSGPLRILNAISKRPRRKLKDERFDTLFCVSNAFATPISSLLRCWISS
jgi:SulP family sulfate permease